jgi:hypothetical protein
MLLQGGLDWRFSVEAFLTRFNTGQGAMHSARLTA